MVSSKAERTKRIYELLEMVDLNAEHANRFIHEFSGGQRQRIGIARALAVNPKLLILDEPISALDVSIQAQVVNMLQRLQKELHLSYLFVAHDLSMVRHISDRVAVMYLGRIVELASSEELYSDPRHPYTQALMSAVPVPDPEAEAERRKKRIRLEGEVPSPIDPPEHCRFAGRCPFATDRCRKEEPQLKEHEPGHWTACFLEEAKEHR
jgi:oligopeptide transport system ATP-binding protein